MVITIYGKDSYRRIRALKEVVSSYLEKHSAYYRFDFEENRDIEELKAVIATNSMFSNKKLVVIDNPFSERPKKDFKNILKEASDDEDLVFVLNTDKKIPAGLPFLKKKPNIYKEQEDLKDEALDKFILREAKKLNISLTKKDLEILKTNHDKTVWAIIKELEKASLRDKPDISHVSGVSSIDFFKNINGLRGGYTVEQRMAALENLLVGRKDDVARVFNTVAYRPRNEKEANRFASYDILIKSGKLEYEEALLAIALGFDLEQHYQQG